MFRKVVAWAKGFLKPKDEPMVDVYGIVRVPGGPKGGVMAPIRRIPASQVVTVDRIPAPLPRPLTQQGLLNDPKSVKDRYRVWWAKNSPDECLFM